MPWLLQSDAITSGARDQTDLFTALHALCTFEILLTQQQQLRVRIEIYGKVYACARIIRKFLRYCFAPKHCQTIRTLTTVNHSKAPLSASTRARICYL